MLFHIRPYEMFVFLRVSFMLVNGFSDMLRIGVVAVVRVPYHNAFHVTIQSSGHLEDLFKVIGELTPEELRHLSRSAVQIWNDRRSGSKLFTSKYARSLFPYEGLLVGQYAPRLQCMP